MLQLKVVVLRDGNRDSKYTDYYLMLGMRKQVSGWSKRTFVTLVVGFKSCADAIGFM